MERKSLYDISWKVTEPEYREDPALSYSTLAKYERNGRFNSLPTLFDKTSSPSLTFGSIVDTLITGSEEDFQNNFVIISDPGLSDTLKEITERLFNLYKEGYAGFDEIPDEYLAQIGADCNYYNTDKYKELRVKKIRESCKPYYNMLAASDGKTVCTEQDVADARACVEALKNGPTGIYFADNAPFGENDVEGFYQLKFKGVNPANGQEFRCMADRIIVNHKDKWVLPIDLKTSSHYENEFFKSFTQWMYNIQATLYWRIIRQNMDKDPYFKDFTLLNYRFVVVNRKTLTPLVWEYSKTQAVGEVQLTTPSGFIYHLRDPYVIGEELKAYLDNPQKTPFGVILDKPNSIVWHIQNSIV